MMYGAGQQLLPQYTCTPSRGYVPITKRIKTLPTYNMVEEPLALTCVLWGEVTTAQPTAPASIEMHHQEGLCSSQAPQNKQLNSTYCQGVQRPPSPYLIYCIGGLPTA